LAKTVGNLTVTNETVANGSGTFLFLIHVLPIDFWYFAKILFYFFKLSAWFCFERLALACFCLELLAAFIFLVILPLFGEAVVPSGLCLRKNIHLNYIALCS
jgi:hypothetical protein